MKYEKGIRDCQSPSSPPPQNSYRQKALNFLLPPRCILCGQPSGSICICKPCKYDLPWISKCCRQCGLLLGSEFDHRCGGCIQQPPPFCRTICPLRYEFPVDRLVQLFKFRRQLASGRVLGGLLCEYASNQVTRFPGLLIPVPLHHWRLTKRGFNQAYELGAYISKTLDIPLWTSSLRRKRNTRAQSGLSREQRQKNLRGAFYWHGKKISNQHVALIDDVMTTGTTVSECAKVLKHAGAARVDIWVAARAIPTTKK